MEGIDQLQSSSRKLREIYNNLDRYQTHIITHAFGSGQDLSINSLLKFAPLAENFQQYADNYKNELNKFQKLLNSVQQTVRRQAQLEQQRQAAQQPPPIVSKPPITSPITSQQQTPSKQSQSVVSIPRDPIKQNGNANITSTVSHPIKKPLISSNNNISAMSGSGIKKVNNASSTNIPRKSAQAQPIRSPNTINALPSAPINTNNTTTTTTTTYYPSQQTEYNQMPPQRQVVTSNAPNIVNNVPKPTISPSKPVQRPVSKTTAPAPTSNNVNVNVNANPSTNSSTIVRTNNNIFVAPTVVRTLSQQQPAPVIDNNINNNNNNNGALADICTNDLIASSQIIDSYTSRRESYREQERMRRERQSTKQKQLSPEEIKANRRRKKREANKKRKARKKAAEEQRQQQSLSPQAVITNDTGFGDYGQNQYQEPERYGFNDNAVDVGFRDFDIDDSKDIRDDDAHFQVTRTEMARAQDEIDQQNAFEFVSLKDIEKPKRKKNKYTYKYVPSETRFDEIWDGNDKYTTTMLRFQGFGYLEEDNDEDKKKVQRQIIQEMKFKPEQVDYTKIRIKKDRTWCIVEVKAPGKFIKDMLKKQKKKTARLDMLNTQNRIKQRKRDRNINNSSQDDSDDDKPIPKQKPVYRITEYERRNNANDQIESSKLYILNFDILNKNCHKGRYLSFINHSIYI